MTTIFNASGQPISAEPRQRTHFDPMHGAQMRSEHRRAEQPKTGVAFGNWAGRDLHHLNLPGGGALMFDLSALTTADFRQMRYHHQVNISLSILNFMLRQIEWRITPVTNDPRGAKIAAAAERNLRTLWPQMVGAVAQAYWAGYSPVVLDWENNNQTGYTEIARFKDLIPEECEVNWKEVEGWAPPGRIPPKFKVYDGIKEYSAGWPIPVENTLWYALMMENGDYYGHKLLKAAFMPWYFSILIHLFSNRYYERFGEPTPIGRAPYDQEVVTPDGQIISGRTAMEQIMENLRSRGVVTLPSDRDPVTKEFDYTLEYMESQMRGVDFDRYMDRLDDEIGLALFTPKLMVSAGGVGSNSLGVQHTQTFMWLLNGLFGDLKQYLDQHVLWRWKAINFSPNAPDIEWNFRKMGKESQETIRAIINQVISSGRATVDLDELGQALGMTVKEVRESQDDPSGSSGTTGVDDRVRDDKRSEGQTAITGEPRATGRKISARVAAQIAAAWKRHSFDSSFTPSFGYERRMIESLVAAGIPADDAEARSKRFFARLDLAVRDVASIADSFDGPADVMALVDRHIDLGIEEMVS